MALTTITVWGATYVVTKGVMSELTAIDVLVTRFTIGFLILAAVAKATGQSLMIQERSDLKLFIASGATGVAAYFTLENCALYFTQAANVGVYCVPDPDHECARDVVLLPGRAAEAPSSLSVPRSRSRGRRALRSRPISWGP